MAKCRFINTKFWSDNYITSLDPLERYLFLYFLTNEHTSICGVYELPTRIMAFETGLEKEMLTKIIKRFSNEGKIFLLKDCWIYIRNFTKHQISTESVKRGIENAMKLIPKEINEEISQIMGRWGVGGGCVGTPTDLSESEFESKLKYKYIAGSAETASPPSDFSLKAELEKLIRGKRRDLQIIGLWLSAREFLLENPQQLSTAIKRNVRAAKLLEGYQNEDIEQTIKHCASLPRLEKFTLETIGKFIDDVIKNKDNWKYA